MSEQILKELRAIKLQQAKILQKLEAREKADDLWVSARVMTANTDRDTKEKLRYLRANEQTAHLVRYNGKTWEYNISQYKKLQA